MDLKKMAASMGRVVREYVSTKIDPLDISVKRLRDNVTRLEIRVSELEAQRSLKYLGVFKDGLDYLPGDFVTFAGSVWHCREATRDRPGSSVCWQLAVKRGADGKDAR